MLGCRLTRSLRCAGMTDPGYTFRAHDPVAGTWHETDGLTTEQVAKLANGEAVAWSVTDERTLVDDDGTITHRETAR